MNETTQIELKKCVERCVRPIRASSRRKNRMRDELLAHLVETFERELPAVADETEALELTRRRFGEVGEIRHELQASVPRLERWLFIPLVRPNSRLPRRRGESTLHYELRWSGYGAVIYFLLVTVLVLVGGFTRGWQFRPPNYIPAMLGTILLVALGAPLSVFIVHAKRKAIFAGNPAASLRSLAASLAAVLTAVAFTVALVALLNLMSNVAILPLANPRLLSAVAVAAAVWVEIQARCSLAEIRRFDQWGSLDIETG